MENINIGKILTNIAERFLNKECTLYELDNALQEHFNYSELDNINDKEILEYGSVVYSYYGDYDMLNVDFKVIDENNKRIKVTDVYLI